MLAEVARIFEGTSGGEPNEPRARQAAALCRKAGAAPEAIPAWIEEGRHRRAAATRPPGSPRPGRRARPCWRSRRPEPAVRSALSRRRQVGGDLVIPDAAGSEKIASDAARPGRRALRISVAQVSTAATTAGQGVLRLDINAVSGVSRSSGKQNASSGKHQLRIFAVGPAAQDRRSVPSKRAMGEVLSSARQAEDGARPLAPRLAQPRRARVGARRGVAA